MKKFFAALFAAALIAVSISVFPACSSVYRYADNSGFGAGDAVFYDEVAIIDADWISGSVNIVSADVDNVTVSESSSRKISNALKVRTRLENGILTIKYAASGAFIPTAFYKELVVSVPRSYALDEISVSAVSATVSINGITTDSADIDSVSGSVGATFIGNMSTLNVNTVSGGVSLDVGEVGSFNIHTVSGGADLAAYVAPRTGTMKSVSGGITLCIADSSGFTFYTSTVSGSINSSYPITTSGNKHVYADGSREYTLETVSGSINVTKR